jgi:hypothetical protein
VGGVAALREGGSGGAVGAVIRTTPQQLARRLKSRHKATLKGIARGALRGAQRGRTLLVRATPTDQGQLKVGWTVHPGDRSLLSGKRTMKSRLFGGRLADLRNRAPHAGVVERGARPHYVSEEGKQALAAWAMRNMGLRSLVYSGPVKRGTGGRRRLNRDMREAAAREIAEAIAWKIAHEGQKPTYFVKSRLDELYRLTEAEVEKAISLVARQGDKR